MARKTVRGTIHDVKHGRTPLKRKIQRASPKSRFRRAATRTMGHPTTIKGWKASSRSFYRRNFGCYTIIMMVLGVVALFTVFIAFVLF